MFTYVEMSSIFQNYKGTLRYQIQSGYLEYLGYLKDT